MPNYLREQIDRKKKEIEIQKQTNNTYTITAKVDQQWFDILGQITRHQEGFVWVEVEGESNE
jgi:hypothetical protein